jgi:hypothetical protein
MKSLRNSFCLLLCQLRDEAPLQEMRGAPTHTKNREGEPFVQFFIKCAWRLFGARYAVQVQINKKDTSCL